MENQKDKYNQLHAKLEILLKKQDDFSKEIDQLKEEIIRMKPFAKVDIDLEQGKGVKEQVLAKNESFSNPVSSTFASPKKQVPLPVRKKRKPFKLSHDLEKFIGENLINKIGIAITVIGVGIGAKYSIDNGLISPLTRIILGYLAGLGLLVFGIKLKKKYTKFSAVLVGGAMAILYFITFAAYDFYQLMPQKFAFALMFAFTVFTVIAAINYKQQIIAHIGLVGAYAVPFLLSNDSGNIAILFTYMAIINIGILVIAINKYWKPLYFVSFLLTWIIYFSWFETQYQASEDFYLALSFLSVFFFIFYLMFIFYKLFKKEKFNVGDILLILSNSFVFFAGGYTILEGNKTGVQLLGLFTLLNAIVHFIVSLIIYRKKLADKNLFYLILGLVMVFITIAIPIQLDGNWVTLLWAGEAALLFWIGRTKKIFFYEKISYALILLAFISIVFDWLTLYNTYFPDSPDTRVIPIFNINFLSALLFLTAFGFIISLFRNQKYITPSLLNNRLTKVMLFFVPAVFLFVFYYSIRLEIETYFNQLYVDSIIKTTSDNGKFTSTVKNYNIRNFKMIWVTNYTLLFLTILSFVNIIKLKNRELGLINLVLNGLAILSFLTAGLYVLSELRDGYLNQNLSEYYHVGVVNIWIRYISLAFVALLLATCYKYINQKFINSNFNKAFDYVLYISVLWILSSELINWMDLAHSTQSYKLGLSILWGVYALFLIAIGIWKKKKYLRIGAMVLFGITLIKLFFYDISDLNTIAKTIVFVSLGILLLIISFLYNKYKKVISDEMEK